MTSARPFAWLLLVAVALSAMPWEATASPLGSLAGAPIVLDQASTPEGGGAEENCCVCLCFCSCSTLLPAAPPAALLATRVAGTAVVVAGSDRAPAEQPRLVFHPPRRA